MCVCLCVCVCVCARARARVCVCVCAVASLSLSLSLPLSLSLSLSLSLCPPSPPPPPLYPSCRENCHSNRFAGGHVAGEEGPPQWSYRKTDIKSLTRTVNSFVDLKCPARGNPTPNITWLKDGQPFVTSKMKNVSDPRVHAS